MDELEQWLIADESGSSTLHFIRIRRESPEEIRLSAVPSVPMAFNPLLVSYVCFIDDAGLLRAKLSLNYFLLIIYALLIFVLIATVFSDDPADQRELPWLLATILIYSALKAVGILTLLAYVRRVVRRWNVE